MRAVHNSGAESSSAILLKSEMLVPREIISLAISQVENLGTGLHPDEIPCAEGWRLQTRLVG